MSDDLFDDEPVTPTRGYLGGGGPTTGAVHPFPETKTVEKEKEEFRLYGSDLYGNEIKPDAKGKLRELFDFPPFTVLNAREGPWQERKRMWLATGIQSEVGRGENLLKMSDTLLEPDPEKRAAMQAAREETADLRGGLTHRVTNDAYRKGGDARTFGSGNPGELSQKYREEDGWTKTGLTFASGSPRRDEVSLKLQETSSGTSIFDPVLTELCYRWFCPPGGLILDPFAGGSVRGIVAGLLGFRYHGIDLRPEQTEANEVQRQMIVPDADITWHTGDSNVLLKDAPDADFVFSCPPYGDLEQYSDDPTDLSAMTWEQFVGIYRAIIRKSVERLKMNRFACFVVGEYRDKETGFYRGFVPLTCASFMAAGAALYNEAILITAVGSLPIRVQKQFESSRKLGKTHQNIIICCKGDPKLAAAAIQGTMATVGQSTPEAIKRHPRSEVEPEQARSNGGGSLAEFLGITAARVTMPDWQAQAPPSLDGIDNIILNFATDGLDWSKGARPVGVTVGTIDGKMTQFLPFAFKGGGNLDEEVVKRWFREQVRGKHILNSKVKFELHHAREWGIDLEEQGNTFSDIQQTAALLDDHRKRFSLDILAADYLPGNVEVPRLDERRHAEYAAHEVVARELYTVQTVARLREVMYPELDKQELRDVQKIEDDFIPVVVEMEKNGALIDVELCERYYQECVAKHGELMMEIAQEVGFGFDHTASGWQRLFEYCHLTPSESYAEDVIGVIDHPLIKKAHYAAQISSLNSKTFSAYRGQLTAEGILRCEINQLISDDGGTVSGRLSVGYVQQVPNWDNHSAVFGDLWFPRRVYISATGDYLEADASQIEYRLFAHFANNPAVLKAYEDDPLMSFHKKTWEMFKEFKPDMLYTHQKNLNFAKQYGARTVKLGTMMGFITKAEGDEIRAAKRWNDPRLAKAKEIEAIYARVLPEGNLLLDRASHLAKTQCDDFCRRGDALHRQYPHRGFVKTIAGRRSRFPTNYKTYIGLNRVLQGSGADYLKRKGVELHRERKYTGFLMRLTVHDALGGDAQTPETLARVSEILDRQSFPQLKVPIKWKVGTGPNWAETK